MTVADLLDVGGSWSPSGPVLFGALEAVDSFADLPCDWGETLEPSHIDLDAASLDVLLCTFLGGGNTTGYRPAAVTVKNDSLLVPELVRGEPIELTVGDCPRSTDDPDPCALEGGTLSYDWDHHNENDWWELYVSGHDATYRMEVDFSQGNSPVPDCVWRWHRGVRRARGHYLLDHRFSPPIGGGGGAAFSTELPDLDAYDRLKYRDAARDLTSVKFTHGVRGYDDEVWFQDTNQYPFHEEFLRNEVDEFEGLTSPQYQHLIYSSDDPSLSAGRSTLRPGSVTLNSPSPESSVSRSTTSTRPDPEKVRATFDRLREVAPLPMTSCCSCFPTRPTSFAIETSWPRWRFPHPLVPLRRCGSVTRRRSALAGGIDESLDRWTATSGGTASAWLWGRAVRVSLPRWLPWPRWKSGHL